MLKVIDGGFEPVRSTKYSACVDLFAREDVTIVVGCTEIVNLGVKIDLDKLYENWFHKTEHRHRDRKEAWNTFLESHKLDLHIRSSLSAKKGLIIANGTGQIDLDYPDEIGIILHNPIKAFKLNELINKDMWEEVDVFIKKGDKVAQITLVEHKSYLMGYESEEERTGGYGSTGEK